MGGMSNEVLLSATASVHPAPQTQAGTPFGDLLRQLRQQRRLSQMELALESGVSARHVSFLETGRAAPSREMVLKLSHCLNAPLRERNQWLMAAGYAPMYTEHTLNDAALAEARIVVQQLLDRQSPFPAIALDRHWNIIAANAATRVVLGGAHPSLLQPPVNILRTTHHPLGLSSRIANLAQVRENHAWRLRQQIRLNGDPVLVRMLAELEAECGSIGPPMPSPGTSGVITPFEVHSPVGLLKFVTATTVFGPVADVTLSELAIELFLPANAATAEAVPKLVAAAL
jgi:transcriptional regulator with XRE-family HTH domain